MYVGRARYRYYVGIPSIFASSLRLLRSGAGVPAASVLKRSTGPGHYVKLQSVPVFALIGQLACERDDCRQFQ